MDVCRPKCGVVLAMLVTQTRLISGAVSRINPDLIRVNTRDQATVKTVDGDKVAHSGDWIVKLNDTSVLVLSDRAFKLMFDKF